MLGIFMLCFFSPAVAVAEQPAKDYLTGSLDLLVNSALIAYNCEDCVKFYEYFAKQMEPITAEQYFKAVYIKGYKKNFGDFISKVLLPEESSFDPDFPMLVYMAQFSDCPKVKITVNFTKEYDNYRINRIEFDKVLIDEGK
jgi:hypothetical protein